MKAFALLMLLLGTNAFGQTPKIKIFVDCTCDDIVGAQYATALRDVIARSPRYELASSAKGGTEKQPTINWVLSIVTMDDGTPSNRGVSTAISVVLELDSTLFSQHVQVCGAEVVARCAATTLAGTDNEIQKIMRGVL